MKWKMVIVIIAMLIILCFTPVLYSTEIDDNSMNYEYLEYVPGTYLIDTEWGQWGFYNDLDPMNECDPDPADWYQDRLGCWSVAIGQIINYHSSHHPDLLQSTGMVRYECSQNCMNPWQIRNDLDEFDYDSFNDTLYNKFILKYEDGKEATLNYNLLDGLLR